MSIKIHFNYNKITVVMALTVIMVFSVSSLISATSKDDIIHPIAELGRCENEAECRAYCEQRDSSDILHSCLDFAETHNLLPSEVIAKGRKFMNVAINGGPGGCRDEKSCVSYCDNPAHMEECLDFAINNDLIPDDELQEAQKVLEALKSGLTTPGNCANQQECIAYCENPAHIDECIAFAEKSGLMSAEEIEEAKKALPFIKSGQTPGGCTSKASCESYCSDGTKFEECISFAQKAGFVSEKEVMFARNFRGKSPGNCAEGASSPLEAKRACTEFCNNPENQPICFTFAQEAGFMTPDQATQIGSLSDFQSCAPEATPEIQECFIDGMGPETFDAMRQGVLPLDGDIEAMMQKISKSRTCINQRASRSFQGLPDDPAIISCISSELGPDYLERARRGEVKCGEAAIAREKISLCMGAAQNNESQKLTSCLEKDCTSMMACLSNLQSGAGSQEEGATLNPALGQELSARIAECTQSQQKEGQQRQEEQQVPELQGQQPTTEQYLQPYNQTLPNYCSNFVSVSSCSDVGPTDSDNYKYCKECYPNK